MFFLNMLKNSPTRVEVGASSTLCHKKLSGIDRWTDEMDHVLSQTDALTKIEKNDD